MDILAAIDHCDEVASRNACNCGAEHRQLAAWLRELEQARETISRLKDAQLDADRYRWLRTQHWDTGDLAVVLAPKKAVRLGAVLPYGEHLDRVVDQARQVNLLP